MARTLAFLSVFFCCLFFLASTRGTVHGQYQIPLKDKSGRVARAYSYKASHALVIGISDYTRGWPRLPAVKKDVKEVTQALENNGFQVEVVENPSLAELHKAYEGFILQYGLEPDNRLLFYFAGHGYTIRPTYAPNDPEGYIVSRDAPLPTEDPTIFRGQVMGIEEFASMARKIEARHVLFLFDSCFSGARSFALSSATPSDLTGPLTEQTAEPVRQFISSGTADQKVPDDSEFRRQSIKALEGEADRNGDGHVTGSELGRFLQEKVTAWSRGAQTPVYGKIFDSRLDKGDFIFPLAPPVQPPVTFPLPPELPPTLVNNLGMKFVLIPAGEFTQGSEESAAVRPPHRVTISQPFYLGKYEVTQGEWLAVTGKNPSHFSEYANLPAENVSWNEVQEFILRLNLREGTNRYRLPTEAEWEHAARASATTAYSFGNDSKLLDEYAWYEGNAGKNTHIVGRLKPNAWGLYDMQGNVWEWCQDWYGDYPKKAVTDPQGASQGAFRVYRGCGWHRGVSTLYCHLASRHGGRPGFRHPALGFRLMMTVPPR